MNNFLLLENWLSYGSLLCYFVTVIFFFLFFAAKREQVSKLATGALYTAFVLHTLAMVFRTIGAGRLPLTNQYEFATSFAWGVSAFLIFSILRYRFLALGTFVSPVVFLILGYASMQSKIVNELMPALQSNWLSMHVTTAIISYGSFGVAFGVSMLYLFREQMADTEFNRKYLPMPARLDMISYRAISMGFLFLSLVIITGAIWAERAWGRYWSWDPKETWSLITWIIYAIYLHIRLTRSWSGKKAAIYAVVGFLCVIFTYIGVNTFVPSIHSYA